MNMPPLTPITRTTAPARRVGDAIQRDISGTENTGSPGTTFIRMLESVTPSAPSGTTPNSMFRPDSRPASHDPKPIPNAATRNNWVLASSLRPRCTSP